MSDLLNWAGGGGQPDLIHVGILCIGVIGSESNLFLGKICEVYNASSRGFSDKSDFTGIHMSPILISYEGGALYQWQKHLHLIFAI